MCGFVLLHINHDGYLQKVSEIADNDEIRRHAKNI
jgi:hypothetical protein